MVEWKLRVGRDTRGRIARHPNPEIIPETFEFFGSRLLVKIGHYNAICVTDQRAWNVSTGIVYRQENKRVKFRVGYRRRNYWFRGSQRYKYLSGFVRKRIETYNFLCIDLVSPLPPFLFYCYFFNFDNGIILERMFNVAGLIDNYYDIKYKQEFGVKFFRMKR